MGTHVKPSFLGVMGPHILGVENLHFSMGFGGPRAIIWG